MPPAPWAVLKKAIDPFQLPENICFVTRVSSRKNEHCCRACTHIHIDTYAYREKERERERRKCACIYIYVYMYICVCACIKCTLTITCIFTRVHIYRINQNNVAQCGITTFRTQKSTPRTRPNLCGMDSSFCSWPCCAGLLAICHWQWRAVCAATAVSMGWMIMLSRCFARLGSPSLGSRIFRDKFTASLPWG